MLSRTGLRMHVLVVVQIFAESTWRLSRAWTLLLIRCSDNSSLPLNVKIAVLVAVPELFLTPESVQPLFRVHRIGSSARPPETVVNMVALELVATSGNVDGPDAWICIYAHTVTWPRSRWLIFDYFLGSSRSKSPEKSTNRLAYRELPSVVLSTMPRRQC